MDRNEMLRMLEQQRLRTPAGWRLMAAHALALADDLEDTTVLTRVALEEAAEALQEAGIEPEDAKYILLPDEDPAAKWRLMAQVYESNAGRAEAKARRLIEEALS